MTTVTATTPLESYRQGRDSFLAAVLGVVSGIEGTVLDYESAHERRLRDAGFELSETVAEKERLERLVGEQALELSETRTHVCTAPVATGEVGAPFEVAAAPAAEGDAGPSAHTDELQASLAGLQRTNIALSGELEAEQRTSADLRAELEARDSRIISVENDAAVAGRNLAEATEAHQSYVRGSEKNFDQRVAAGVRTAAGAVRGEAVRIMEAIAADNPSLAEAVDLFTVAFPVEAAPTADDFGAPVQQPALETAEAPEEDYFASIQTTDPEATGSAAAAWDEEVTEAALPATEVEFLHAIPAATPMTQAYLPAPDLSDDAILDPNFFDTPQTLDVPAGEAIEAPEPIDAPVQAPKPGYGLFGRKKESLNV